jgi:hypothetical protein
MSSGEVDDALQPLQRKDVPGSSVDGAFTGEGKVPKTGTARQKRTPKRLVPFGTIRR